MIKHIKRLLGIGQAPVAPTAPTPYKVEAPAPVAEVAPFPAPKKSAKKPAVKKATTAKPKKPKAPKA